MGAIPSSVLLLLLLLFFAYSHSREKPLLPSRSSVSPHVPVRL